MKLIFNFVVPGGGGCKTFDRNCCRCCWPLLVCRLMDGGHICGIMAGSDPSAAIGTSASFRSTISRTVPDENIGNVMLQDISSCSSMYFAWSNVEPLIWYRIYVGQYSNQQDECPQSNNEVDLVNRPTSGTILLPSTVINELDRFNGRRSRGVDVGFRQLIASPPRSQMNGIHQH